MSLWDNNHLRWLFAGSVHHHDFDLQMPLSVLMMKGQMNEWIYQILFIKNFSCRRKKPKVLLTVRTQQKNNIQGGYYQGDVQGGDWRVAIIDHVLQSRAEWSVSFKNRRLLQMITKEMNASWENDSIVKNTQPFSTSILMTKQQIVVIW